jgi:hypothetical protein
MGWRVLAKNQGLDEDKVEDSLERMKRSGEIYEPRYGIISPM